MKTICCLLVTALVFLCACQPTPEFEAVKQKLDLTTIEEETSIAPVNIPSHYENTAKSERVTVRIDADIKANNIDDIKIVKYAPKVFNQEFTDQMVSYFGGDSKLYRFGSTEKRWYTNQLILAKKGQWVDGAYIPPEPDDPYIKELEEKIAALPEDAPRSYTTSALTHNYYQFYDTNSPKVFLDVGIESGSGYDGVLQIKNFVKDYTNRAGLFYATTAEAFPLVLLQNYLKSDNNYSHWEDELDGYYAYLEAVSISKEEALESAYDALEYLGLEYLVLLDADLAVSDRPIDAYANKGVDVYNWTQKGGFYFTFGRKMGDCVPIDPETLFGAQNLEQSNPHATQTPNEKLTIFVTENGIEEFIYTDALSEVEMVAEQVPLMPFEEAMSIIENQFIYTAESYIEDADKTAEIDVDKIELKLCYTKVKNSEYEYLLVPVWCAYGAHHGYSGIHRFSYGYNILINAIDGSLIEVDY